MRRVLGVLMSGVMCVMLFGWNVAYSGETIVIKGSTTVLPVAQATAEAYMKKHPEVNISLSGGGSGNGIKSLIDKSTDIADASRFIKTKELDLAIEKGVYPVPHRIAIDAIVPIVHLSNPVNDLTIEQMSLIYQGKIKNWKEVGGKDMQIVVVSRDTSSGTYEVWQKKVLHKAKVTPRAQMQASNGAIVQVISKNKYAIGYIGFGYLNISLCKAVEMNGVKASVRNALSGAYPIARPLFMFTDDWPKGRVLDFINFVLSPEGQEIAKKEGLIPIY
ncbi:MAG: phosphate ABC transporter substrate-binding protein [Thermodesulfobacteriota bacterium]|nr:phosphate ABC transporter substrate-binding protein [Thermodesulfobacteriota bacterium]